MKKILFILTLVSVTFFAYSQTFVSTEPANKNVILEEYTGKACGYCPDGHRIAQEMMADNPGRVFAINIHQGNYASGIPNYTTQFGNALANQTGLTGFPSGTVNRHIFSGNKTALGRGEWESKANIILATPSPVNVAAEATLDWATRELTVVVEAYYTGNAANSTNMLNVALLQNNILGPQSGGSYFNPTMMVGDLYKHMHMLRHLITGQWGDTIHQTTTGSFFTKTYTYTLPEHINNVNLKVEDIEIIVFIAEGRQEILTGSKATITPIIPTINPRIDDFTELYHFTCDGSMSSYVTVKNVGSDTIKSLEFEYTVAGGTTQTFSWNARNIPLLQSDTINLPELNITTNQNQTIQTSLSGMNGGEFTTTPISLTINKKVVENAGGYMAFKLVTDRYASETTFKFFRPDGSVLLQGGPFANLNSNGTTTRYFDVEPDVVGCYRLEVYDEYGDGINAGYGAGGFQLIRYDDVVLLTDNGKFGFMARYMIDVEQVVGVEDVTINNKVTIFPNPTEGNTTINISLVNDANVDLSVYNMYGQLVHVMDLNRLSQGMNSVTLDATQFASGIYLVKVAIDGEVYTQKLNVR